MGNKKTVSHKNVKNVRETSTIGEVCKECGTTVAGIVKMEEHKRNDCKKIQAVNIAKEIVKKKMKKNRSSSK